MTNATNPWYLVIEIEKHVYQMMSSSFLKLISLYNMVSYQAQDTSESVYTIWYHIKRKILLNQFIQYGIISSARYFWISLYNMVSYQAQDTSAR